MGVFDKASLALVPDGIKDGKLYSIKPTDGSGDFTFTRCDGAAGCDLAATRVDENGLIEKGRENLLLQSNQFDLSPWGGTALLEGGQAGYDGTNNAWLVTKTGSFSSITQTVSYSGIQSFSVYLKAGDSTWVRITRGGKTMYFDLVNGEAGAFNSYSAIGTPYMESVGNGWYRCIWALSPVSTNFVIYPAESDGDASGTSGSIYVQDAQLEAGLVATDYIESGATTGKAGVLEDLPRIDYTGGTPSLLMEPSRTNLVKYSEYFETTSWWFSTSADVELSDNTSPEGVKNAFKVTYGAGGNRLGGANFGLPNTPHTNSIYMRKVSGSGVVNFANQLGDTNNITLTTDWERYDVTATLVDGTARFYIYLKTFGDVIEVYGAQQEEGSYPTSYIPTYGATATRSDEDYSNTSLSNIGSTNRCTFYCEIDLPQGREGSQYFLRLDGPTSSFAWKGNYVPSPIISIIGTGNITSSGTITLSAGVHKLIVRWENGVGSIFVDGVKKTEQATSSTTEVFDEFRSQGAGYRHLQKSALVFPEALSDAECITLTT